MMMCCVFFVCLFKQAEQVEYTYPFIYFRVDDFDEIWKEIVLSREEQMIGVELLASSPFLFGTSDRFVRLFSGALSYEGRSCCFLLFFFIFFIFL